MFTSGIFTYFGTLQNLSFLLYLVKLLVWYFPNSLPYGPYHALLNTLIFLWKSAIAMAAALEIPNLQICSDSQTLIRAINNKMQDKEIYGILNDIHQISSVFGSISFSFLPRQQNKEADELAKRTLQFTSFQFCNWPNGPNI